MKMDFTPAGGGDQSLADDSAKFALRMEQLGLVGKEQLEAMFGAAAMFRLPLGNTSGDCVFTVTHSHATIDAAIDYFKTQVAMISLAGSLVYTGSAHTITMNPANLKAVVAFEIEGKRWGLRYTFGITTMA